MSKYLPRFNHQASVPRPSQVEEGWGVHHGMPTLSAYASALEMPVDRVKPEKLKSLPSPWARLLLFEQALFNPTVAADAANAGVIGHPAHREVAAEWRGLLALLCLAKRLGVHIEYKIVDVPLQPTVVGATPNSMDPLAMLGRFIPTDAVDAHRQAWGRHAIIFANNVCVGATSPRTLFYTTIRPYAPNNVPFLREGRFLDPVEWAETTGDAETLQILESWVKSILHTLKLDAQLRSALNDFAGVLPSLGGMATVPRAEKILEALADWQSDMCQALHRMGATPMPTSVSRETNGDLSAVFSQGSPAARVLEVFGPATVIAGQGVRSDLEVHSTSTAHRLVVNPGRTGVIYERQAPYTGPLQLPRVRQQVVDGRFSSSVDVESHHKGFIPDVLDAESLWEPKLVKISSVQRKHAHVMEDSNGMYLLPFKPDILGLLQGQDLARWLRIKPASQGGLHVTLAVPVQGGREVRFSRTFSPSEVSSPISPRFAFWPDFVADDWQHYHYVAQAISTSRSLQLAPIRQPLISAQDVDDPNTWWTSAKPMEAWQGLVSEDQAQGLLVLSLPKALSAPVRDWNVAIDFGSTHTRAFFRDANDPQQGIHALTVSRARSQSVITDNAPLDRAFFGGQAVDAEGVEHWSMVYLPKGAADSSRDRWLPSEGLVAVSMPGDDSARANTRTDLKWHRKNSGEQAAFRSYLSHLVLMVHAEARDKGARISSLRTAVPSVLPATLRTRHQAAWEMVAARTHVSVTPAITESHAVAMYLHDTMKGFLNNNIIAVDVGGSTSDLAVWMNSEQVISDSIRFAGDIVGRLLDTVPLVRDAVQNAVHEANLGSGGIAWLQRGNNIVFTHLLHQAEEKFQSTLPFARYLDDGNSQANGGVRLLAHLMFFYAALAYVTGLFVRTLNRAYQRYDLRFAGRGSGYLAWLDIYHQGASREVPSKFFLAGLGHSMNAQVDIDTSGASAKQEVGRGLLVDLPVAVLAAARSRATRILEHGFQSAQGNMEWSATMDESAMAALGHPAFRPDHNFDSSQLPTLLAFVEMFASDSHTKDAAALLGIRASVLDNKYRDALASRMVGPNSPSKVIATGNPNGEDVLIEPAIVTELKVLLEHATDNMGLFS